MREVLGQLGGSVRAVGEDALGALRLLAQRRSLGWHLLVILSGYGFGLATWDIGHPKVFRKYLRTNTIAPEAFASLWWTVVSCMALGYLFWVGYSLFLAWRGGEPLETAFPRVARAGAWAILLPMISLLGYWGKMEEAFRLLIYTLLLSLTLARLASLLPPMNLHPRVQTLLGRGGLLVLMALYAAVFISLSIFRHRALGSSALDLGLIDQRFWNTLHGRPLYDSIYGRTALGRHFSPIVLLLVPLYWLWQDPRSLLVIQALAVALTALPLYWLAREKLKGELLALTFAASFLLAPRLEQANIYDFHIDLLELPLMAFAFYYLEKKKAFLYGLMLALLLLSKEHAALFAVALGVYALLKGNKRWGLATIAAGLAWGILVLGVLMPTFGGLEPGEGLFFSRYSHLGEGPWEMLTTLLFNPPYILSLLATAKKLKAVLILLVPLGLLPLAGGASLLLPLVPLLANLLSGFHPQQTLDLHYSAVVYPFLFVAAIHGAAGLLATAAQQRGRIWQALSPGGNQRAALGVLLLTGGILANRFFSPWPLGRQYRPDLYRITEHTRLGYELLASIPADAPVSAQSNLLPHLSHRPRAYLYPDIRDAEYILLDATSFRYPVGKDYLPNVLWLLGRPDFSLQFFQDGYMLLHKASGEARDPGKVLAALEYLEKEIVAEDDDRAIELLANLYCGLRQWERGQALLGDDIPLNKEILGWGWDSLKPAPRRVVDVGSDDLGYVKGFYHREQLADFNYRWSGERAYVRLPLEEGGGLPRRLTVRLSTMRPPDSPATRLRLVVNGRQIAEMSIEERDWESYGFPLPPELEGDERAELILEIISTTWVPKEALPGSEDARSLGIAVDRIELE